MAFSFRISSFDFNLFDFGIKNRNKENLPKADQPPAPDFSILESDSNPVIPNFDFANRLSEQKDLPILDISVKPADIQIESDQTPQKETIENKPVANESTETEVEKQEKRRKRRDRKDQTGDDNSIEKLNRLLRRKFRREYKETKNTYSTNISFHLSHTDLMQNDLYINRNKPIDNYELTSENERYYEKEKEKQDKEEINKKDVKDLDK